MLFADTDGAMIDVLKVLVTYVISPLVLALTGIVGVLIKWNMQQSEQLKELEASKKDLEKTAAELKLDREKKEKENGQLVQKVQELQSTINLHREACKGSNP